MRTIAGTDPRGTSPEELRAALALHRGHGRRIVFTNGCFDLLHAGHVAYLGGARALRCVDLLVGFDADTPVELLRAVRPDVFVKGGDYRVETLPEAPLAAELGGEVVVLPYLEGRSTGGMLRRLRDVAART